MSLFYVFSDLIFRVNLTLYIGSVPENIVTSFWISGESYMAISPSSRAIA